MGLDIRKELVICDNLQKKLDELKKLTGNSEGSIIRVAILMYHKSIVNNT